MNQVSFALHQRVTTLRWVLPLLLGVLTVLYEIGPGRWIHDGSVTVYFDLDIAFYGLAIPILTFATISLLGRWLERKEQAEKVARVSTQRLAAIMTASADAIVGIDEAGRIEAWNRGAELLFGRTSAEICGQQFAALFGVGEAAEVEWEWLSRTVQQTGFLRGHETTCRDSKGDEISVELTATQLRAEQDRSSGMSIILRDITERKQRDVEIRHLNISLNELVIERTSELAKKLQELARANAELQKLDQTRTEFVSVVSHQIRAPLTNMRGAIESMRHECFAANPTCTRLFGILDEQIERLDRLVNDVLSASRIEAGELVLQSEPISLLPVVQQVVEQIRTRTANRPIEVLTKPGLPLVFADRDRVAEVIANLLDNADKFSPPGKTVTVDMRADQTEVTLSVRDFGSGLRPHELDRVFEKFYRADNSDSQTIYGYGLGLYVCRQLVLAQKGRIWAENSPHGGAIFSFALPIAS